MTTSAAAAVLDRFRRARALLEGHFRLTSGLHSPGYLQCALVLQHPREAEALGLAIADRVRGLDVQTVLSPALGGIVIGQEVGRALGVRAIFAERQDGRLTLRRGFALDSGERVLVVEDVVTTGGSTRETIDLAREIDRLTCGSAGGHDVLDDEHALAGIESESAPQRQPPVLPLGKDRANAQRAADLLADHDSAEGGRQHGLHVEAAYAIGNGEAERFGFARMLQHERALQIPGTVQSGGEAEVAFEQRACAAKAVEDGSGGGGCHANRLVYVYTVKEVRMDARYGGAGMRGGEARGRRVRSAG